MPSATHNFTTLGQCTGWWSQTPCVRQTHQLPTHTTHTDTHIPLILEFLGFTVPWSTHSAMRTTTPLATHNSQLTTRPTANPLSIFFLFNLYSTNPHLTVNFYLHFPGSHRPQPHYALPWPPSWHVETRREAHAARGCVCQSMIQISSAKKGFDYRVPVQDCL